MQAVCQKIGGTDFDSMYNKHQAIRLQVTVPVFMDGADQQTEYEYDENGNLTKDLNKNISRITYNLLNLPKEIMFMDGSADSPVKTEESETCRFDSQILLKPK